MNKLNMKMMKKTEEYKTLNSKYVKEIEKNKKLGKEIKSLKIERNKQEKKIAFLRNLTSNISKIVDENIKCKEEQLKNNEKIRKLEERKVLLTETNEQDEALIKTQ